MVKLIELTPHLERKKTEKTPIALWIEICELTCGTRGLIIPIFPVRYRRALRRLKQLDNDQ